MPEEGSREVSVSASLPPRVAEWVERRAAAEGVSRDRFLARLVAAYRAAESDGTTERLATEASVEELRQDTEAKIDDVRERIVQVKREADEKAPADHDHPDLVDRVADAVETAATAEDAVAETRREVESVEEELETLSGRVDDGFDNYEEILEQLRDATDDLQHRTNVLAQSLLDVRDAVRTLGAAQARRDAAGELREEANRAGVDTAACEDCGGTVTVSLLNEPACPHCDATFTSVSPSRRFFGTAELVTGTPPALEAGDEDDDVLDAETDLEDLIPEDTDE